MGRSYKLFQYFAWFLKMGGAYICYLFLTRESSGAKYIHCSEQCILLFKYKLELKFALIN